MNALTGMEKFSHLEDKIYLTIEFAKKMRDEKEKLEKEVVSLRRDAADAIAERRSSRNPHLKKSLRTFCRSVIPFS